MPDLGRAHRPFRFSPPTPTAAAVLRPRLLAVLDRRFEVRVVTIEAEAGHGKTTVLAQAVAQPPAAADRRDCWLSCEPSDASASTLLAGLLRAVGGDEASEGASQPTLQDVCDAVWSQAPVDVCLVLDDVHNLDDGSPGADVVRRLVDELPANGHVVLAGRRLTALPRARLVLHERAVELTEDDLRFDDLELAGLAEHHGVEPAALERARGWPALAELYARVGGTHAEQFVWEEIVGALAPREREALLLLVAVGGAEAGLLDAVADGPFDRERIARLPLVATDQDGGLRPHPLWQDLLRGRIDDGAAADAARRVARALLERGEHDRAFELLVTIDDWDEALPALFQACNDQRRPPWRDQMERWRSLIPESLSDRPETVYLEAMIARERDPWSDTTNELFLRSIAAFRERGDVLGEITTSVRYGFVAWIRGDTTLFVSMQDRMAELIALGLPLSDLDLVNRAVVADIAGDPAAVRELLARVADIEPRLRHIAALLRVFAALHDGEATGLSGDAALAAEAAEPIAPAAGTGWAALAPALVAWVQGDLDAAVSRPIEDPGPRFGLAERVPTIAVAAITAAHLGRTDQARSSLEHLDAVLADVGDRHLAAGFRAVAAATVAAAAGDEQRARDVLAAELDARPLDPAGAGRAIRWFPAVPYLLNEQARALLDTVPQGGCHAPAIGAARALLGLREGEPATRAPVLDDPSALVAALPAAQAVELVARSAGAARSSFHVGSVALLADLAPTTVRETLRRLAHEETPVAGGAQLLLATVPIPPPHQVRIEVLGPPRLLVDGASIDDPHWRRVRVRQLVAALVAFREIRRERLGVLLWPDFDDKALSSNLRQTLSYLQTLLEPHRDRRDAPWFLQQAAGVLSLRRSDHLGVDAWELEDALSAADEAADAGAPTVELEHLSVALGLWRGEYLEDVAGEDWAEPLRERVRHRFLRGAVRAGDLLLASGRIREASAAADRALAIDPAFEPAIRLAISAHLGNGDRAAAHHTFTAGVRALADLGVSPEPATVALGQRTSS